MQFQIRMSKDTYGCMYQLDQKLSAKPTLTADKTFESMLDDMNLVDLEPQPMPLERVSVDLRTREHICLQ